MQPQTSATFVLKIIDYFGDACLYEVLSAIRKLEKDTEIHIYSWKTDYKKRLNSADYWNDIDKLKNAGFIELKGEKAEITEHGKKSAKEFEYPECVKNFLEKNYWRNLLYK